MAEVDPQLLEKIRTAAQAARHAADSAQAYASRSRPAPRRRAAGRSILSFSGWRFSRLP